MTLTSLQAAKYICMRSGWTVSNLALQKILYLASMWHIGRTQLPLIQGEFEAWDYGPVQPRVYHRVKVFGSGSIRNVFYDVSLDDLDDEQKSSLDAACNAFLDKTPGWLVALTHDERSAWRKRYLEDGRNPIITHADMIEEYRARWPHEPQSTTR